MFFNESFEVLEVDALRIVRSSLEALINYSVIIRYTKSYLLNGREHPIVGADIGQPTTHCLFKVCFSLALACCQEWVLACEKPIKV